MSEIWILGAAGRVGSGVARALSTRGLSLVLVGRDRKKLEALAATLPTTPRVLVATFDETLVELQKSAATVVVNTVGPFARTMLPVVRAMPNGARYVDVTNELASVLQLDELRDDVARSEKSVVVGAGYGFVSTESVVRKLCADRPAPMRGRVDAIPFIAGGESIVGEALAASIIDSVADGGRAYQNNALVPASLGLDAETVTLPDGRQVTLSGGAPTGDLEAARRATSAPSIVAGSSELPSGLAVRLLLPMFSALLSWRPARDFAVRRLAAVKTPPAKEQEGTSWARARVEWSDGTMREGWFRAGDGMTFTANVMAETAARLAAKAPAPGTYTPCELYGPALAESAGAELR